MPTRQVNGKHSAPRMPARIKNWRDKAEEIRAVAATMKHIETQAVMYRLAEDYDALADKAEAGNGEPL